MGAPVAWLWRDRLDRTLSGLVGWAWQWTATPVVHCTEPKPVRVGVAIAASAGPSVEAQHRS